MIIDRFGSAYATAYQLPILQGQDDWATSRPPVLAKVGGMNGAFDFYGTSNYPLESVTVKKSFTLAHSGIVVGTGTLTTTAGSDAVVGSGTLATLEIYAGDYLIITSGEGVDSHYVESVTDDTHFTLVTNATYSAGSRTFTITRTPSYAGVEFDIDTLKHHTINAGESKLWGLLRSGSQRWAYAKCIAVAAPESYENKLAIPVSVEFALREGLWYAATQSGTSIDQTDLSYDLVNNGSTYAAFELTLTSATGTLTAVTITNTTNGDTFTYTGSAAVGKTIIVKTGAYSITNDGTGAYTGLTYGANQVNWLRLNPGSNAVTISVTGSTAWSGSMEWWDTYL